MQHWISKDMVNIPDKLPNRQIYEIQKNNYRQIKNRLQTLQANAATNTPLQNTQLIGLILNDFRQALKTMYGIQKDDDT